MEGGNLSSSDIVEALGGLDGACEVISATTEQLMIGPGTHQYISQSFAAACAELIALCDPDSVCTEFMERPSVARYDEILAIRRKMYDVLSHLDTESDV